MEEAKVGLVFEDVPLLSNLDVLENIVLPKQIKSLLNEQEVLLLAQNYIKALRLEIMLTKRPVMLNTKEQFLAKLARALLFYSEKVVIVEPLHLLRSEDAASFFKQQCSILESLVKEIEILELARNQHHYEGVLCKIEK